MSSLPRMSRSPRFTVLMGAVVVVSAWLLIRIVTAAAGELRRRHSLVVSQELLLARARQDIQSLDDLEDSARLIRKELVNLAPDILPGHSPATAHSEMARRIELIVEQEKAGLKSIEPVVDSGRAGGLARVTGRVSFESDVHGLSSILSGLSTTKPLLTVSTLQILAANPGSTDETPEMLLVEALVSGWFQLEVHATSGASKGDHPRSGAGQR